MVVASIILELLVVDIVDRDAIAGVCDEGGSGGLRRAIDVQAVPAMGHTRRLSLTSAF